MHHDFLLFSLNSVQVNELCSIDLPFQHGAGIDVSPLSELGVHFSYL